MRALRAWLRRCAGLFGRVARRELRDELDAHLAAAHRRQPAPRHDVRTRRGARRWSRSAASRRRTRPYASNSTLPLVETVLQDVRFALRLMRRSPVLLRRS